MSDLSAIVAGDQRSVNGFRLVTPSGSGAAAVRMGPPGGEAPPARAPDEGVEGAWSRWETVTLLPPKWREFRALKHEVQDAAVRDLERRFLLEALQRSGGNVSKAAEEVGMQRTNFHSLMRKHGLAATDV